MNRREFLRILTGSAALAVGRRFAPAAADREKTDPPLNFLLITADDMNWDSVGVYGCKVPGITPNIDRLAAGGLRFQRAHITIAVCQPCRQVLMTGRYPHRNGGMGFYGIRQNVPTLQEALREAGYFQGILGKVPHLAPAGKFPWDVIVKAGQLRNGRGPELYRKAAADFFAKAKAAGKPFFLMANSHDPHRPFVGARRRRKKPRPGAAQKASAPAASRIYEPQEAIVPAFLPDIPNVRREVAQYFGSVHRCDETVGAVLSALAESALADNTLVMFFSDHGMAFPFAKTNCYFNSTRTPWICRWPGRIKPGTVDREHFISGIDFMPTILAAAGVTAPAGMDGKSFLPLLTGGKQAGREEVFTVFHETAGRKKYPMRCLQDRRFGYIYNAWADGKTVFRNESQSGLSMNAMKAAAQTDERIAARVKLFLYRVPEELYDFENDPAALKNLVDDPKCKDVLKRMRARALATMTDKKDPLAPTFREFLGGLSA